MKYHDKKGFEFIDKGQFGNVTLLKEKCSWDPSTL